MCRTRPLWLKSRSECCSHSSASLVRLRRFPDRPGQQVRRTEQRTSEALMRSRHVHDPDFSAKRGCVWGPGLALLLFVLIIVGVLVGLYRWSHYLVPPPSPPSSPSSP